MVTPLRILFFGTPAFAVPSLCRLVASPHLVAGVVCQPDRPSGRGQRITAPAVKTEALRHGLGVYQPTTLRRADVTALFCELRPDLGVVAAYGRLIPNDLLAVPRLGMINVHASLLPRYRGAAPVHRAVIAGDAVTGVTIMRVIRELDAGGMFARASRPIGSDETADEVERDLAVLGAGLLMDVIRRIDEGTAVEEPQDSAQATYAPKLTKDEGRLDWQRPAQRLHDLVRGLYPWPHASTTLAGTRVTVLRTEVDGPVAAPPGTVVQATRHGIAVACGDGRALVMRSLRPEGRRAMDAAAFLAGRPVEPGTRLES
ncbi:MAG: methionyl-tRNA formyltransferase [Acidimicrobiia bacterium]|nr:methionyl-tRNA formyltransferase [Acidimicrobiia bacterium]